MTKNTNFINLTPHTVTVFGADRQTILLQVPSSGVARVNTSEPIVNNIASVPVVKTEYQDVENLPAPQPNTIYIVSILVLQALKNSRPDVVAPNTSPKASVRGDEGQILGVTSFTVI